jgi:hypothetical protein
MKPKIILFLSLLSLFIFSSCKKETTSPIETIPQNLFPLKTGNAWFYTGYQIDTAGNKISGTEFNSSTTIVGQIQFEGKNPFLVIDSLKYQRGPEIDTLLIYLENDYLYAWIDLTNMVSIPGFTYKRWVPFIKTTGALNCNHRRTTIAFEYKSKHHRQHCAKGGNPNSIGKIRRL